METDTYQRSFSVKCLCPVHGSPAGEHLGDGVYPAGMQLFSPSGIRWLETYSMHSRDALEERNKSRPFGHGLRFYTGNIVAAVLLCQRDLLQA